MIRPVTGVIENWVLFGRTIIGEIHHDVNKRWLDGTLIQTSTIRRKHNDYVITLNSIYRLGRPL